MFSVHFVTFLALHECVYVLCLCFIVVTEILLRFVIACRIALKRLRVLGTRVLIQKTGASPLANRLDEN